MTGPTHHMSGGRQGNWAFIVPSGLLMACPPLFIFALAMFVLFIISDCHEWQMEKDQTSPLYITRDGDDRE